MLISIIAAIGNNRVVGIKNSLPWNMPADMEHFRSLTMGKPIIMGQRTFESIGKALPGRTNIVLTMDKSFRAENCNVAYSIEEALKIARNTGAAEVMIGGGVSVYKQFLPLADRMYLTLIEADFAAGDAFFPEFDYNEWEEMERVSHEPDERNVYPYSFIILQRRWL